MGSKASVLRISMSSVPWIRSLVFSGILTVPPLPPGRQEEDTPLLPDVKRRRLNFIWQEIHVTGELKAAVQAWQTQATHRRLVNAVTVHVDFKFAVTRLIRFDDGNPLENLSSVPLAKDQPKTLAQYREWCFRVKLVNARKLAHEKSL